VTPAPAPWARLPARRRTGGALLAAAVLLAACGRADDSPPAERAAPAPTAAGAADRTAAARPVTAGHAAGGEGTLHADSIIWSFEATRVERPAAGVATLLAVRTARHDGFDRVVFEFDGSRVPPHTVEYAGAVSECGSGEPVELDGVPLTVRFTPARAHTDAGRASVESRDRSPGLPALLRLRTTCDFEAHLDWVLAIRFKQPFSVSELDSPPRVIIDVRHPR
jgi:hypothetical protein